MGGAVVVAASPRAPWRCRCCVLGSRAPGAVAVPLLCSWLPGFRGPPGRRGAVVVFWGPRLHHHHRHLAIHYALVRFSLFGLKVEKYGRPRARPLHSVRPPPHPFAFGVAAALRARRGRAFWSGEPCRGGRGIR